jgi:glycogen synthase
MTGGLAIVVENIVSLISKKGVNFTVIIPYYNLNNDNISNYLQD